MFNLKLLSGVETIAIHPDSLYRYYKRDNAITQSKRVFQTIEIGYQQIFEALAAQELELTDSICKATIAELSENQRLNRVFYPYIASLNQFDNGSKIESLGVRSRSVCASTNILLAIFMSNSFRVAICRRDATKIWRHSST